MSPLSARMSRDRYSLGQRQKQSSLLFCPHKEVLLRFFFFFVSQFLTRPLFCSASIPFQSAVCDSSHHQHHHQCSILPPPQECVFWPKVNVYQCKSTYLRLLGRIASQILRPLREILVYGLLGLLNIITSVCEQVTNKL